jgi:hypothetical protein
VGLVSLVVLAAGFVSARWLPWRKVSAYLLLCIVVGPGLIVNLGFKDHWGRPRPKDTLPFGGRYRMETVWTLDPDSPGKSFPCGHCTMGFSLFGAGLILRRQGKRRRAVAVQAGALVLGALLGTARILQGGHFASDVLWGFGFCWLTVVGLFHALRLDEDWVYRASDAPLRAPGPVWFGGILAGTALLLGVLLATPYHAEERRWKYSVPDGGTLSLELDLQGGPHRIVASDGRAGEIRSAGQGHGLPGSKVKDQWNRTDSADGHACRITFTQRIRGWFTELDQRNEVTVPGRVPGTIKVRVRSGQAELDGSAATVPQEWTITVDRGARARWRSGGAPGEELEPGETLKRRTGGKTGD